MLFYIIRDIASDTHKSSKKGIEDKEEKEEERGNVEKEDKEGEEIVHPTAPKMRFQEKNAPVDQTTSKDRYQHQHQKHHSAQSSVLPSPLETDYMMVTAYDEAVQSIFGNISACEVAVSLTKNRELRILQNIEKQRERRNFDEKKKKKKEEEKEEEKEKEEVRKAGCMNTNTTPVNSTATNYLKTSIVAGDENSKDTCLNNETKRHLSLLPSFNFSKSCAITADSLIISSLKKDQFIFLLRLNQFVDENGFRISGGRSALSLEGILPPY
jgi:hypothetical protein